ncbi:hypothetical protein [Clostridium sp. ZBS4]|uniref:hypothetical protein n=1 Tax=Clostridium sp. ZBS4 TaxID=2949974 RepID=UPI00207B071A|nr:hypothetical protein [Clostridium sp. ZBS4]
MLANIKTTIFLVLGMIFFSVIYGIGTSSYRRIQYSSINKKIAKKVCEIPKINCVSRIMQIIIISIVFGVLVTLQQKYKFIYLGESNNYLNLIIGVLTLYGIFYVFIQFTLNYSLQIKDDKYWGRSKTKLLLMDSKEYIFFNSIYFKCMLLFSTIMCICNEKILEMKYIIVYKEYVKALWVVSIALVFILYIFLFIKSIKVMMRLFTMQEHKDVWLNNLIRNNIKEEYKEVFNYYYKEKTDDFIRCLMDETVSFSQKERIEMITYVIKNIHYYLDIRDESDTLDLKKIFYSRQIFSYFWNVCDELKLNFEQIEDIYKYQNRIINSLIDNEDISENIKNIEKFFKGENTFLFNNYFDLDCNMYFDINNILWTSIDNKEKCKAIYGYIVDRQIEKQVIYKYLNNKKLTEYEWLVIKQYSKFIFKLLDKCVQINIITEQGIKEIFRTTKNRALNKLNQEIIYRYIVNLEYNQNNIEYFNELIKLVDYKYKVVIIFYMILYTGNDTYYKWGNEIKIFRNDLINDIYNDMSLKEEVVVFICKYIEKSNIGHKIKSKLVKWICNSIYRKIDEKMISECNQYSYINYLKLLKFKYIFNESNYGMEIFDFQNIKVDNLIESGLYDWRIEFLNELTKIPNILKEKFFFEHQEYFYKYFIQSRIPERTYSTENFKIMYVNRMFYLREETVVELIKNIGFFQKGLCNFLILKLAEKDYKYLLINNKISEFIRTEFKRTINNSGMNIKTYITKLIEEANKCICNSVSDFDKENIFYELNKLIFNEK